MGAYRIRTTGRLGSPEEALPRNATAARAAVTFLPRGMLNILIVDDNVFQAAIDFAEGVGTNQVLKGRSKAIPDDRTNQIILLTVKENMPFFGRIIRALDVPANEHSAKPAPPRRSSHARTRRGLLSHRGVPRPVRCG